MERPLINSRLAATKRLVEERKAWRKNQLWGFVARPRKNWDGSEDYFNWLCFFPGTPGTPWEVGQYRMQLTFRDNHPKEPPIVTLHHAMYHPNIIFPYGIVMCRMLGSGWKPTYTIKDIMLRMSLLLVNPELETVCNQQAAHDYVHLREIYEQRAKLQAMNSRALEFMNARGLQFVTRRQL